MSHQATPESEDQDHLERDADGTPTLQRVAPQKRQPASKLGGLLPHILGGAVVIILFCVGGFIVLNRGAEAPNSLAMRQQGAKMMPPQQPQMEMPPPQNKGNGLPNEDRMPAGRTAFGSPPDSAELRVYGTQPDTSMQIHRTLERMDRILEKMERILEKLDSIAPQGSTEAAERPGHAGAPPADLALSKAFADMTKEIQQLTQARDELQQAGRALEDKVKELTKENSELKSRARKQPAPEAVEVKKQNETASAGIIKKWRILGLSANRIVLQDSKGNIHNLGAGDTLAGIKILSVDIKSGNVKTSAGLLQYDGQN